MQARGNAVGCHEAAVMPLTANGEGQALETTMRQATWSSLPGQGCSGPSSIQSPSWSCRGQRTVSQCKAQLK